VLFDDDADLNLLTLIADGDRFAIAEAYDRYAPTLLSLAQAIVGPSVEAEELLHELFLEAWRLAPSWQGTSNHSFPVWLFTRMRQRCLQELVEAPELGTFGGHPPLLPPQWRERGRFDFTPVYDAVFGHRRSQVHSVLGELSHSARQCLELCLFEGLAMPELMARTQQTQNTILGYFAQAHQALSQGLRTEWS
jgi:RNA polymerase sigma-70 factor (ECF subfamily)